MTRRSLFGRLVAAVAARKVPVVMAPAVPTEAHLWIPEGLSTFDERFRPGRLTKIGETLNLRTPPRFTATPIPVERIPIPIRWEA